MKKNYSLFGMPNEVKFCKKCVISNQRPSSVIEFKSKNTSEKKGIEFGKNGICSACRYAETKNVINWDDRELELKKLCDKFRKNNGYDVIVPGSGGKDSAYTAHILKYKYGMNPLTVTWAPHIYTDIGWENFVNWSKVGGFDNILFSPNGKLHRLVTKLAFENLLHPFQPFIIGQKIIGPLMASKFNIPLVFYGENGGEYGNNIKDNESPKMKLDFFSNQDVDNIFLGGLKIKEIIDKYKFKLNDFQPYIAPTLDELKKNKTEVHFLGYYLKWDQQEAFYYASENTGFKVNNDRTEGTYSKYVGLDDKIERFHFYTYFIKFGIGQATYDAAQEIRSKKITRDEGVALVKKFDEEFPQKYFKDFLDYIDITEDYFWKCINKFRSPHLWHLDEKDNKWKLINTII
jgi:N-acetyl sugar amidotransferase